MSYAERNRVLRQLGYVDYAAYLASPLWSEIRGQILYRSPRCCACPRVASQVHHRSYAKAALTGEDVTQLVSICRECHSEIEFAGEEKLSLTAANNKLDARIWKHKEACRPVVVRAAQQKKNPKKHRGKNRRKGLVNIDPRPDRYVRCSHCKGVRKIKVISVIRFCCNAAMTVVPEGDQPALKPCKHEIRRQTPATPLARPLAIGVYTCLKCRTSSNLLRKPDSCPSCGSSFIRLSSVPSEAPSAPAKARRGVSIGAGASGVK